MMVTKQKNSLFDFGRMTLWLSTILFFLLVLLFNAAGWYLYQVIENSREDELGKRLITAANMVSSFMEGEALLISFDEGDEDLTFYKDLKKYLEQVKTKNALRTVAVYNLDYEWQIGSQGDKKIGEENPLLRIDDNEISTAISAKRGVQSYLYSFGDEQFKRAYSPITDYDGSVTAFVVVEADRAYFAELAKLRNHLILLGLICLLVTGILFSFFYKLVSRLLKAEEDAAAAIRLQSLGTMAAGVAHEIRNPLGIIRNTTELMRGELSESSELREYAGSILEEVLRINSLVNQFLQLAKPQSVLREKHSVEALVLSAIDFVKHDFEKAGIIVEFKNSAGSVSLVCDSKQIRQLLLNILINAKEAMNAGGKIFVMIKSSKNQCEIIIEDEGQGISKAESIKLFDPFYTTKQTGTGLGLSICKTIVDAHNGDIEINDRKGDGAVVTINLPLVKELE